MTRSSGRSARRGRPAAVQPRLPGGREHPGLALRGRVGPRGLRAGLAQGDGGQPVPGDHGEGLLPPLRDVLQPRAARRGRGGQLGRGLPGRRSNQTGLDSRRDARALGQARAHRRRGTLRSLRGVPPVPPRPRGDDPRGRPDGGRDDAIRDPQVPPAARSARRGGAADPRHGGEARAESQGHEPPGEHEGGALRRRLPRGGRPHRQARLHPGRRGGSDPRRRVRASEHGGGGETDAGAARRRLRRGQHRDGCRPHREAAGCHGGHRRLPAHARADAGARVRGRRGPRRRA
jgi:hypothetical protein